jgi:hypothetical protein
MEERLSKIYPQKWVQILFLLGFCFTRVGKQELSKTERKV